MIEINSRESSTYQYIFIQNYGKEQVDIHLPENLEFLLGENRHKCKPLETIIARRTRETIER